MQLFYSAIFILPYISWFGTRQVCAIPLNQTELARNDEDQSLAEEYANLKYDVIHNLGYSVEFAEMVEVNLKRAVQEERARQRQEGAQKPDFQRQGMQGAYDYEEEESTMRAGPTTPGASPGDIVRGIAGIITSLGTFNPNNFFSSFVNFFPQSQREQAQAVVDSALGRRPSRWPTLPTTTTKMTTTTKDEYDIYSEETTKPAVTAAPAGATATTASPGTVTAAPSAGAGVTQAGVANVRQATEVTRAPTTKYTLIRRTGTTELPDNDVETTMTGMVGNTNNAPSKVSGNPLDEDDEIELLSVPTSATTGPTS